MSGGQERNPPANANANVELDSLRKASSTDRMGRGSEYERLQEESAARPASPYTNGRPVAGVADSTASPPYRQYESQTQQQPAGAGAGHPYAAYTGADSRMEAPLPSLPSQPQNTHPPVHTTAGDGLGLGFASQQQHQENYYDEESSIGRSPTELRPRHSIRSMFSRRSHEKSEEAGGHDMERTQTAKSKKLETVEEEESELSTDEEDSMADLGQIVESLENQGLVDDREHTTKDVQKRRGYRLLRRNRADTPKVPKKEGKIIKTLRGWYVNILSKTLVTRSFVYWLPLALILFIPLACGAWANPDATVGHASLMWLFIWIEIVWGSLWVTRIVAHYLPLVIYALVGIVAPGFRKYVALVVALEMPLALCMWSFVSFITFYPIMTDNHKALKDADPQEWQRVLNNVLVALFIGTLVYFCERLFVQMLSISFHKTRFSARIKENKRATKMLGSLLEGAYNVFPPFCEEFELEDAQLENGLLNATAGKLGKIGNNVKVQTVAARVNRVVGSAANVIGNAARDASGNNTNGNLNGRGASPASKLVANALGSSRGAEVLANRIWKSLVLEDSEALTIEDLFDVMGRDDPTEVLDMFDVLDADHNGDLTLDEMVQSVKEVSRERKRIYRSLKDMDVAISKLHSLLLFIVMIIIIIIFIGMLAPSVGAVLATLGSSLLALSFIFSATCQEILASCVFLFVKHPLDIGDMVQIQVPQGIQTMKVTEISLLYTVLQDIGTGVLRQASNAVLNTLWIDNYSRSGAMSYAFNLVLGVPETTEGDIQRLREGIDAFIAENPRDFYPGPYIQVTDFPDLDRIKLTINVTMKSNFADAILLGVRRTKFIACLSRLIRETPLHIPRREDTYSNPATPMYSLSVTDEAVKNFQQQSLTHGKRHGGRPAFGMLQDPIEEVPEEAVVETEADVFADPPKSATEPADPEKAASSARRESGLSRADTTLSRRVSRGLRKR